MKSHLYHLQVNIDFQNVAFYKGLMEELGWKIIFEEADVVGYKSGTNGDLWFVKADHVVESDYDAKGINHVSLRVDTQSDVDAVKTYLENGNIRMLFDTPRHRPEFASDTGETYYQIMFASPDNILFEVVYVGLKSP